MQVETTHCENIDKNLSANVKVKTKLDECIDSIVKNEGYATSIINKKKICADGGNYLGVLYEIDIKGETNNGYKETAIFCKTMTPDPVDMGFLSLQNIYKVELFAYKGLSKMIQELQDETNMPINERYNTVKCYNESNEQMLLMENLSRKGFKTWYRMDIVSLDMAEECIKQLARFHGISYAMEQLRPNYFKDKIKNIKTPFTFNKEWNDFYEKFYKIGMDNLNKETKCKMEDKLRNVLDKFQEYCNDKSSHYCLCHGDYRPNNIMIREENGKVVEAMPVDFQLMSFSCPLLDFFYFMYMATDYDFRKAHMDHLKNLYYNSLDTYLQYFEISVESVFPRIVFENLYKDKRVYGIMVTFLYVPFLFVAEGTEVPDVTTEKIINVEFKIDHKFKDRINGIIQEFIDIGIL